MQLSWELSHKPDSSDLDDSNYVYLNFNKCSVSSVITT